MAKDKELHKRVDDIDNTVDNILFDLRAIRKSIKLHMEADHKPDEIDWSKPQYVKCTINDRTVLTTGDHNGNSFSGVVVESNWSPTKVGKFKDTWSKHCFEITTKPINSDTELELIVSTLERLTEKVDIHINFEKKVQEKALKCEIDWSKRQLVRSTENNRIILTNEIHNGDIFEGTVIKQGTSDCSVGEYNEYWMKKYYTKHTEPVTIDI